MADPLPAYRGDQPFVFVCYAHADSDTVYPEIRWLQDQGVNVWYDEGISPGAVWRAEIAQAIRGCRLFLFVVTPRSVVRDDCLKELYFALEARRPVLAVHLEPTELKDDLQFSLGDRQAILRYRISDPTYRSKLAASVSDAIEKPVEAGPGPVQTRPRRWSRATWAASVVLTSAATFLATDLLFRTDDEKPLRRALRADLAFPESRAVSFYSGPTGGPRPAFRLSPDGTKLVYVSDQDGQTHLRVRDLEKGTDRGVEGTDGGYQPSFSASGKWISFFSLNQVKKVDPDGGRPMVLAEITSPGASVWAGDHHLFVAADEGARIVRLEADGSAKSTVFEPPPGARTGPLWPTALLPNHRLLISSVTGTYILDLTTNHLKPVSSPSGASFVHGGFLFTYRPGGLDAARFDSERISLISAQVRLLDGLRTEHLFFGQASLSNGGTLVYAPGGWPGSRTPMVSLAGQRQQIVLSPSNRLRGTFEISPDGRTIAIEEGSASGDRDIWLWDLATGHGRKLTIGGRNFGPLVWMPGGDRLVYHRYVDGRSIPYVHRLDAGRADEPLIPDWQGRTGLWIYSLSEDGRLAGAAEQATGKLFVLELETGDVSELPSVGDVFNQFPMICPNGSAVAHTSTESGMYRVYLQPYPFTGRRIAISRVDNTEEPRWNPDGSKLYYRSLSQIRSVDVSYEPELATTPPQTLYTGRFLNVTHHSFDVMPNGDHALAIIDAEPTARVLRIVTNWMDEVEAAVAQSEREE